MRGMLCHIMTRKKPWTDHKLRKSTLTLSEKVVDIHRSCLPKLIL